FGYRLGFTAEGKLRSIYEKEIHFTIRLLQPPCSTCLSSLSRRHLRRDAWHGRVLQRLRPEKRGKHQPGCSRHADTRRGTHGRSCSFGHGLARPSLGRTKSPARRATPVSTSAPHTAATNFVRIRNL